METINRCLLTFLVNSLWQIPLAAAVAALACRFMRNSPASHRHGVWVAAMVSALLLPLASMIATGALWQAPPPSPAIRISPPLAMPFAAPGSPHAAGTSAATGAAAPVKAAAMPAARTVPFAAAAILLGGYALFLLFRLGQLAFACLRTIQIRRAGTPAEPSPLVRAVWERSENALRVSGVELFASTDLAGPVTAGAWRKTIILPEPLLAGQSEDVLTTAIGHEMAHIARHDFALNLLYELMYLPLAFHPAAALIRRGIERTRELACDELVTRSLMDPRAYARSIMSIAAGISALPRPALRPSYMLGVFDGDILEERIKLLLARPAAGMGRSLAHARLVLATALTALAACVVIGSGLAVSARAQSASARAEMKLASDAYNAADFPSAVQHFTNAVQADPSDLNAKLFLANALIREHNATEPCQPCTTPITINARQQYADVLARDPSNKVAMEGMLSIALETRQLNEAHDWALKITQIDPQAKTAFYSAGFVDWSIAYPPIQTARKAAGLDPRDQTFIPDAAVRKGLARPVPTAD